MGGPLMLVVTLTIRDKSGLMRQTKRYSSIREAMLPLAAALGDDNVRAVHVLKDTLADNAPD